MINIFTMCYNFTRNSYSKAKGFVWPDADRFKATSAKGENAVNSPNNAEASASPRTHNFTIKSIFKNMFGFTERDNNQRTEQQTEDENPSSSEKVMTKNQNTGLPPVGQKEIIQQTESLNNPPKELTNDEVIEYIKNLQAVITKTNNNGRLSDGFTKALDNLAGIPNATLEKELPDECIKHFISNALPEEKSAVVQTETFRSLLAILGSSVRSVLYALTQADISDINKLQEKTLTLDNFMDLYSGNLIKTNMPYKIYNSALEVNILSYNTIQIESSNGGEILIGETY